MSERTPFFFGPGDRRLFGFYHAPVEAGRNSAAVLVCPPLGKEHLDSHRCLHYLAGRLAAAGCGVMRFDYYGVGDSEGDGHEVTLPGMVGDVVLAIDQLRERSGPCHLTLIGLGAGATALCVLDALPDTVAVKRIVLWDPFGRSARRGASSEAVSAWALGYSYGEPLLAALRSHEMARGLALSGDLDVLIVESGTSGSLDDATARFQLEEGRVDFARFPEVPPITQPSAVPYPVVSAIVEWVAG